MLTDQDEQTKGVRSWRTHRIERPPRMQEQMPGDVLEELAREGARQLLAQALEAEVAEFIEKHRDMTDRKVGDRWSATGTCQNASWSRASGH